MDTYASIASIASTLMRKQGKFIIWFGDPDLWGEVFAIKNKNRRTSYSSPEQWKSIYDSLRYSKQFTQRGSIKAKHPVFELVSTLDKEGDAA